MNWNKQFEATIILLRWSAICLPWKSIYLPIYWYVFIFQLFRKNLEELDDTPVLKILFGRWEIWKVLRPTALCSNVDTFIVKSAIEHLVKTGPQVCISRVWRWFMAACPSNNKKRQNWPARHSALLSWAAQLCPIYLVAGWPAELSSFKERPHVASRAVR